VRVDITPALADGTPAFLTAPRAIVAATVFAPAGDVVLGAHGDYRGAYVGRSVWVRPGGRVREDSAFPPPPRRCAEQQARSPSAAPSNGISMQ
jgi:hypothetical protein